MNSKPKISVIIAVYNAELTLKRCIDSVLAQTLADFELILINDGSVDNSAKICDEYSLVDDRIRVVHKKNGGVASARKMGVECARGLYSIHVDSDDWVEPDMLEKMIEKSKDSNSDVVIADYFCNEKGKQYVKRQNLENTESRLVLKAILEGRLLGSLCNKLIKHSLYQECHVYIDETICYCEDVLVLSQILKNENIKIAYAGKAFYHYDLTKDNSITRNFTRKSFDETMKYYKKLNSLFASDTYYKYSVLVVLQNLFVYAFVKGVIKRSDLVLLRDVPYAVLKYSNGGKRHKILSFLLSSGCYYMAKMFLYFNRHA